MTDINTQVHSGHIPDEVLRILSALLGNEQMAVRWWEGQNYAFGLKTPQEVWQYNQTEVLQYLYKHCYK